MRNIIKPGHNTQKKVEYLTPYGATGYGCFGYWDAWRLLFVWGLMDMKMGRASVAICMS